MRSLLVLLFGAVAILAVVCAVVYRGRPGASAAKVATPSEGLDRVESNQGERETADLRRRLAVLTGQVGALRLEVQARAGAHDEKPARDPGRPSRDPEALAKHEQALREHAARLESVFRNEAADPRWSAAAAATVVAALDADDVAIGPARRIECRSSTCRVEIADDARTNGVMPALALKVAGSLNRMSASHADGPGGKTLVLYLSRGQDQRPERAAAP
jgi:hypothetical protein